MSRPQEIVRASEFDVSDYIIREFCFGERISHQQTPNYVKVELLSR